jgi:tetratricopeptide (TPR) repeat protein
MNFQLDRGLFQFDFTDRHAILGVSVNAQEVEIRERYMTVARLLHPDSAQWKTEQERNFAISLFSRLVTQAYGNLSRASTREEQAIVLQLLSKRMVEEGNKLEIVDPLCQQLYESGNDFEIIYGRILAEIATTQYLNLSGSIAAIEQISELNMVYLLRKQLQLVRSTPPQGIANPASGTLSGSTADLNKTSPIEGTLRRADEYLSKKNWGKAVLELREATSVEPNNPHAHALLGLAYLHQQQKTMAKISIDKAIKLNPNDPHVLRAKQEFDRVSGSSNNSNNSTTKVPPKKASEGIFGLFKGKK